ncbi:hypothetical protein BGZ63DRAFT_464361 [Mariannaea sp. PMI_226]|nr:hypothetical protein BGZ63DRAFT_464361 [Mariannaea sp. PMI_226]
MVTSPWHKSTLMISSHGIRCNGKAMAAQVEVCLLQAYDCGQKRAGEVALYILASTMETEITNSSWDRPSAYNNEDGSYGAPVQVPEDHFRAALGILDESKNEFLSSVCNNVEAYIHSQTPGGCLSIVEIQKFRNTDGSIREEETEKYPFSLLSLQFGRRFSTFLSSMNGDRPQYDGKTLDSSLTSPIRQRVRGEFQDLYANNMKGIIGCLFKLSLLEPPNQAKLAEHARVLLLGAKPPLPPDQLAFLNILDDKAIVDMLLHYKSEDSFVADLMPQDPVGAPNIELPPELLESIEKRMEVYLRQQQLQKTVESVTNAILVPIIVSSVIAAAGTLIGAASLAAVTWYAILPLLAPVVSGAIYKWKQLPYNMGKEVTIALHNQLDHSYHDYHCQILQHLLENVIQQDIDKTLALVKNKMVIAAFDSLITSIDHTLALENAPVLKFLLETQYKSVTEGKYAWIRELDDMGLEKEEIIQMDYFVVHTEHHITGCVHRLLEDKSKRKTTTRLYPLLRLEQNTLRSLQQLCGLAGIVPSSRDVGKWNGSVRFNATHTLAAISYSTGTPGAATKSNLVAQRIVAVLEGLCRAFAHGQSEELFCDSFTILRRPGRRSSHKSYSLLSVEMCRVDIGLAWNLLEALKIIVVDSDELVPRPVVNKRIRDVLQIFIDDDDVLKELADVQHFISYCCLAVQFLSLGFLSYTQAHIGTIQPFFLDTPLDTIHLLGDETTVGKKPRLQVSLTQLTCVGDMIRAPVMAFEFLRNSSADGTQPTPKKYDLISAAEDLVETWGPGEFIFKAQSHLPFAIQIGGGLVYATAEEDPAYHWSRTGTDEIRFQRDLNPTQKYSIGSSTVVNRNCIRGNDQCWEASSKELVELGPKPPSRERYEDQIGVQVGQYFILQMNTTFKRINGVTLKEFQLSQPDEVLIRFLDRLCGLQVSFCTGVCRRVTLREMVADVLPQFETLSRSNANTWKPETVLGAVELLRDTANRDWTRKLSPDSLSYIIGRIRMALNHLKLTGFEHEGKTLKVAWPNQQELSLCLQVDCSKSSSWASFLADSEDCATFAYMTTTCLETEAHRCPGSNAKLLQTVSVLQTGVVRVPERGIHPDNPEPGSLLPDGSRFFFKKMGQTLFVRVDRIDRLCVARLKVVPTKTPSWFQNRLRFGKKKRVEQLREKRSVDDSTAESVLVGN